MKEREGGKDNDKLDDEMIALLDKLLEINFITTT